MWLYPVLNGLKLSTNREGLIGHTVVLASEMVLKISVHVENASLSDTTGS